MATSLMAVVDPGCIGHQCTYLFDVQTPGAPAVTAVTHGPTCIAGLTSRAWPIPPAGALAASLPDYRAPGLVDNVDTMAEAFGVRVTVADGYLTPPTPPDGDTRFYEVDLADLEVHQREGLLAGTWRIAPDPRWPVLELIPGWHRLAAAGRELVRRGRLAVEALRYGYEAD